jgi:hypothetical protein
LNLYGGCRTTTGQALVGVAIGSGGCLVQTEPYGWLCSETLATRSNEFEFVNGYPTDDTAQRLGELQLFNRATEVYLTQLMPVSEMALRQGLRAFGVSKPTQVAVHTQQSTQPAGPLRIRYPWC